MKELAYLNGEFGPIEDARISIEDRGFQFGDGIYEVVMVYGGKPFRLAEHLSRLRRSAGAVDLQIDSFVEELPSIIAEGLERTELDEALIYIQITRGVASRSHAYRTDMKPTTVLTFKQRPAIDEEVRDSGIKVITVKETRWSNCYVKAITLLPNILAKGEAIRRGFDDAIFVTDAGEVRELTSANVFVVVKGEILTPPRNEAILHGVTMGFLIDCAQAINLEIIERAVDVDALRRADEVFMSSSTVEVLPITRIDDDPIADGRPGPITQRLYEEFVKRSRGGPPSGRPESDRPDHGRSASSRRQTVL